MKIIDLAEQTRLFAQTPGELADLRTEIEGVQAGDINRPVREIAPIAVRTHHLAIRCLQQLDTLSTSQYAGMKDGHENLAYLSEAALRISVAASLCTYGITGRTDALLYQDGDRTAQTSRRDLAEAVTELDHAADTYRVLAQNLSRRLASAAARAEDRLLIDRAAAEHTGAAVKVPSVPSAPVGRARAR
ncbi:hypothetical protein [Streptomyces sp. CC208A]|uniref:hypothetical protein n=1 Tax=Streptomyces sp. CC208A TaxID=3044573 RepID=UPI0024A8CE72|nr:hypothetical protein [Streptomyces sp. CC208A]